MKPLVIYHGGCIDGFTAAWAAWKKLGDEADYFPGKYQEPLPRHLLFDINGNRLRSIIYLLDFSYPFEEVQTWLSHVPNITMLDHHQSAMKEWLHRNEPWISVIDPGGRSGATMAWNYFHHAEPYPELLLHVEDRDLWRFKLDGSRQVHEYLAIQPQTFAAWDYMVQWEPISSMISKGQLLLEKTQADIKKILAVATRRITILGHDVPCVNIPHLYGSEACHVLDKGEKFAAYYFDGPTYREFGLRSAEDGLDVSEIARQFGGGGHQHAAGFKVTREEAEKFEIKERIDGQVS